MKTENIKKELDKAFELMIEFEKITWYKKGLENRLKIERDKPKIERFIIVSPQWYEKKLIGIKKKYNSIIKKLYYELS